MKVKIDADTCTGCGLCADSVSDIFEMGDDIAKVINPVVPSELEGEVQEATDNCPVEAIIIESWSVCGILLASLYRIL